MTDMRTPLNKVRGLGSAKEGTDHFWKQRLTAVANVFLISFFVILECDDLNPNLRPTALPSRQKRKVLRAAKLFNLALLLLFVPVHLDRFTLNTAEVAGTDP